MRTYYELEDYHWDMINDRGMVKGKKVWFADIDDYDKIVNEGVIVGHDIHIEGDVELKIEVIKETEYKVPDNVWLDDESKRSEIRKDTYTKTIFMDDCFYTKQEAFERGKKLIDWRISRLESKVEYEKTKLDKLKREKNRNERT